MLVAFAGLPGSGKSTIAREIAYEFSAVILDKDHIRAGLFPPEEIEYSTRQDDFCISILLQVAEHLFQKDPERMIFLDGRPFIKQYQVQQVVDFCQQRAYLLMFVECVCSPETARDRLSQAGEAAKHIAKNRNYELYLKLQASAEPIPFPHLQINTDNPLELCLKRLRAYIIPNINAAGR